VEGGSGHFVIVCEGGTKLTEPVEFQRRDKEESKGRERRVLLASGGFWWLLVASCGFWWVLVGSGEFWVLISGDLAYSGEFW
jgi:apolipoprotein N-acyltransferase